SLPLHITRHFLPHVFIASLDLWHQRLGHANLHIVHSLLSSHNIKFVKNMNSSFCVMVAPLVKFINFILLPTFTVLLLLLNLFVVMFGNLHPFPYDHQSCYILFYNHYYKLI
ncbi:hypothetical protein LINGRAHAP2_LOCUS6729, partial [Linum grandiflorum]